MNNLHVLKKQVICLIPKINDQGNMRNNEICIQRTNVCSTPPGRAAAFEEFKQTRGVNLNKIYLENKEILTTKKKQFAELARRINQTKADIDKTRIDAERKKNERLTMGKRIF